MISTFVRAGAAALAAVSMPLAAQAAKPAAQPNIVFILVDDLRFDAMGFLTPGLKTPNIDYLAKNGVYFPNAVVTSSLCSPSRATILTGQTTRNHRIVDNNNASEAGLTFFPKYLQEAGYQTAFFGKWHMGQASDGPRPGFDHWVSFKGQGTYFPTDGLTPQEVADGKRQTLNVDGKTVAQTNYITDELTDYELEWLDKGRDKTKPFFIYMSHKAVHSDAKPAPRHADQYKDFAVTLPASAADTPENRTGKPMWVQNQRNSWHGVDFAYHSSRDVADYFRDYYRTLSAVDDSVGRTLDYLRKHDLEKNTLVVFMSDNGFLMGEHGLIDKRNAYEPSVKVPMVAFAPGMLPKGVVNETRVRNLDLAPTFLDVAGVKPPPQFEGRSVLPVATGEVAAKDWVEDDFVYEYYWEWTFPQTPTTFAIERGKLKYIQYHGIWDLEELYDLSKDPGEMTNLIDDPAYLQAKIDLRARLFAKLANDKGEHVVPYTDRYSSGLVWRDKDGSRAADFPPQWQVVPDRPDRLNGVFPDSPGKAAADKAGRPYLWRPGR
ncbi:sulfatase [Phenylobacterium sp. 58.2.17]|uniref:sulfatase family protein n=1 Tax=Phenylobacterium sp. 58.2.17 TaxID=2969306 RepID=UPI0022655582|nr:sulfatase [Phenylobacterium sp. 58.2.17]MCX7586484.1 sulfatase [Phenylobacterium sp. 58.2.17]